MPTKAHHRIVVIGGGNAGSSIAGRLRRAGVRDVVVLEPRETHIFTPLQSHIAGGVARSAEAQRSQLDVTPRGVTWIRNGVTELRPEDHEVVIDGGSRIGYEHLIVCPGIEMRWDLVPGLAEAMRAENGASSHDLALAGKASRLLRDVQAGTVVFTQAPEPASCGSVALKPMLLACDWWRSRGVLDDIRVVFASPRSSPIGVAEIDAELLRILDEYGIETRFDTPLTSVDAAASTVELGGETLKYDVLMAAPPQTAPAWLAPVADAAGFVDIDPSTFRHRRFDDVWSIGDAAAVDTLRSGGAIRKQSSILSANLRAVLKGSAPREEYDGYTVCPVTVSRGEVVFAEFDRHGRLAPTVPFWRRSYRANRLTWIADRRILPWIYWHMIVKGRA